MRGTIGTWRAGHSRSASSGWRWWKSGRSKGISHGVQCEIDRYFSGRNGSKMRWLDGKKLTRTGSRSKEIRRSVLNAKKAAEQSKPNPGWTER